MKKWLLGIFLGVATLCQSAYAINLQDGFDTGKLNANQVTADTTNFSKNLSGADTDVQHALNTLDQLVTGSGNVGIATIGRLAVYTASTTVRGLGTPTLCSAGQYATGIDSGGNATGCTAVSSGQWLTIPNVGIGTYDNVGIGTITPVARLTILGNVGIGTVVGDNYLTTAPPNGGIIAYGNVGIGSIRPIDSVNILSATGGLTMDGTAATQASLSQSTNNGTVAIGRTSAPESLAQNFTTSTTGTVNNATYAVNSLVGSPSQAIQCRIETTSAAGCSGGSPCPTGTLVNANATAPITPSGAGTQTCTFTPFSLAAGTYALVVYSPSNGGGDYYYNVGFNASAGTVGPLWYNSNNTGTSTWTYDGTQSLTYSVNFAGNSPQITFKEQGSQTADIRTNGVGKIYLDGATSGTNYVSVVSGNVGVGTIVPPNLLYVAGTTETQGFKLPLNPTAGYILTSNSVGVGTWTAANTLNTGSLWATQNTTDQSLAGGNVGIGTTKTTTAALTIMNGNVGIGTWVPATMFDMKGSMNVTNNGSVGGIGTINMSSGGAAVNNTSASAASSLNFQGGSSTTSGINFVSTNANGTTDFMNFKLGNSAAVTAMKLSDNSGIVNVGIGTTFGNAGLAIMNGSVGIGTWNPTNMLQVNGTIATGTGNNAFTANTSGTVNAGAYTFNGGLTGTLSNSSQTAGANVLIRGADTATGFVQIQSTNATGTSDYIKFTAGTAGDTEVMRMQDNSKTINIGIGTTIPQGSLVIMPVGTNGNVGIGTWKPAAKLQINGNTGIGWTVKAAANQACNTTCNVEGTCVFGFDQGTLGVALGSTVVCTDATADECICAGP